MTEARRCEICRTALGPPAKGGSKSFRFWAHLFGDRDERARAGDLCAGCWAWHLEFEGREPSWRADPIAPLCAALSDPDEAKRRRAAYTLGTLGDRSAVDALCAALLDQERDDARGAIAGALGAIGGDRAAAGLMAALRDVRFWYEDWVGDVPRNSAEGSVAPALEMIGGLDLILRGYVEALDDAEDAIRRHALRELGNVVWRSDPNHGVWRHGRPLRESDLGVLVQPLRNVESTDTDINARQEARSLLNTLNDLFPDWKQR